MKRIISFALCVVMIFSCFAVSAAAVDDGEGIIIVTAGSGTVDGIDWVLDEPGGTLTFTGSGTIRPVNGEWNMFTYEKIVFDGEDIIIDESAFNSKADLKSVVLNGVKSVGFGAFYGCTSLSSVKIGDSVEAVSDYAFFDCTSLGSVRIPETVTSIGEYAFGYYYDFEDTGDIAAKEGFVIEACADSAAKAYCDENDIGFFDINGAAHFFGYEECDGGITLTSFSGEAEDVLIPEKIDGFKVVALGSNLFANTAVKNVTLSKTVKTADKTSFTKASALEKIECDEDSADFVSVDGILFNSDKTVLVRIPEGRTAEAALPESVKETAPYACAYTQCAVSGLDGIGKLGEYSFFHSAITEFVSSDKLKAIPAFCFAESKLTSFTFGSSVKTIGDYAFYNCDITLSEIPQSVKTVGSMAFYGCEKIVTILIPTTLTSFGTASFGYFDDEGIPLSLYGLTVYGKKGSPAEKYAKDNGIAFVAVTLDVPKVRSAVVDNDTITLRFDKVDGAVEYQIYRKVGKGAFELLDTLAPAKAGIYSDADVEEGSRYTYYVIADGVNACSEFDGATVFADFVHLEAPVLKTPALSKSGITIKWTSSDNYDGVTVYRKTESSDWAILAEISGTAKSFVDTTAKKNTKYTYTVTSYKGTSESEFNSVGVSAAFITAPVLVSAKNGDGGVTVTWKKTAGADKYWVYRKTSSTGWKKIAAVGNVNTYFDKTAKSGTLYSYTVVSYCGAVRGFYDSKGVSTRYLAKPVIDGTAITVNGVLFQWMRVQGAKGYYVYRKLGSGSWTKIATVKATNDEYIYYVDSTAANAKNYSYTVRAYYSSYMSVYDKTGSVTRFITAPKLNSITGGPGNVHLGWKAISGVKGYYVYRRTINGEFVLIGKTTGTKFTDKTAKKGAVYNYSIRAYYGSYMSGGYIGPSVRV